MDKTLIPRIGTLKNHIKLKTSNATIDNAVFRLHYRATFAIFLVSTIFVTTIEYKDEHIQCAGDKAIPEHVLRTFCFFTSTFTVVKHLDENALDQHDIAHLGVGPYSHTSDDEIIRHAYYQWVPFVLFGQAIAFYLTHLLWKNTEGTKLQYISKLVENSKFAVLDKDVEIGSTKILSEKNLKENVKRITNYLSKDKLRTKSFTTYLILFEVVNLLHVILQFYLTDVFLDGQFFSMGSNIISDDLGSSVNILDQVFPKVTKCTFHKYGPSGTLQTHDAICVMALNVMNEKIYSVLWFWFVFLICMSGLALVWRILQVFLHKFEWFNKLMYSTLEHNSELLKMSYDKWLFYGYLYSNIESVVFNELPRQYAKSTKTIDEDETSHLTAKN